MAAGMIPQPKDGWFGAGVHWSPRHQLGFGYLSILEADHTDPLHLAIGRALSGSGADTPREVLKVLSGVIAGELMREGVLAGKLKTECELFMAESIVEMTAGKRMTVAAAERAVAASIVYSGALEQRRVSEARVVGLRAYADTVRREQEMHRTDRADARAQNFGESDDST